MITVKESFDDVTFRDYTKKEFECPHCHQVLVFRTVTVEKCGYCLKEVTNVRRLIKDQDHRINYHAGLVD